LRWSLRRAGPLLWGLLSSALLSAGCGSSEDAGVAPGGSGGTAGQSGASSIEFSSKGTLELGPSQAINLRVQVKPAGHHVVRFSLNGDSLDASLAATEVSTAQDGSAETTLFAPSKVSGFAVRAAVGTEVSTSLTVSVSELGFGTLRVTPDYAGKRPINSWTASVHPGRACADLKGNPPPDGALWATVSPGQILELTSVPAGSFAAVTLRASQFAGGCSDLSAIVPGKTQTLSVHVLNRPLQLADADLSMSLGLDALDYDWQLGLDSARANAKSSLLGDAESDPGALLDAMADSLDGTPGEGPRALFQIARSTNDWDQAVAAWLGAGAPSFLRDALDTWFEASAGRLVGERVISGHLRASGATPGWASWELDSVAGLTPKHAGFPTDIGKLGLSSDPDDSLLLGGSFFFFPTRMVMSLAEVQAVKSATSAEDGPAALAELVDCDGLGAELAGQGSLFDGCDAACGALACAGALELLFTRASSAANFPPASLQFSAAAATEIDAEARPTAFKGSWIGDMDVGAGAKLSVSGVASGVKPSPPQ